MTGSAYRRLKPDKSGGDVTAQRNSVQGTSEQAASHSEAQMATDMNRSTIAGNVINETRVTRRSLGVVALVLACLGHTGVLAQDVSPLDLSVIDITQRVIGGNDAVAGQYPSIVALVDTDVSGFFTALARQFCGGTVIDDQWVMTAAHCVHNDSGSVVDAASLRIVEGSLTLRESTLEELIVTNIIVHPGYDHNSLDTRNDIALLEMATPLVSQPVALFQGEPDDLAGVSAAIAGWGATEFVDDRVRASATTLQQASLPIVSLDTCNAPTSYDGLIQPGQMCAGFIEGGVDGCVGDSGGPLYIESDGGQQQVGITSFGVGCAEPNFYGVYTSVANFVDWIDGFTGIGMTSSAGSTSRNVGSSGGQTTDGQEAENIFSEGSNGAANGPLGLLGMTAALAGGAVVRRRERARRLMKTPS